MALGIWAFSFSIVNSTQNYELVVFWRRVSSFGWGTIFSLLLHFLIILTGYERILKRKWVYLLLYVPAVMFTIVYGINSKTTSVQYRLIFSNVGWVNASVRNFWDTIYNIYYISFSFIGLLLLVIWLRKAKDADRKRQAYLLISSFAIAVLFGTLTELILNVYTSYRSPQMAPIIGIFPILAIFYSVKRYGLMIPKTLHVTHAGEILNKSNRVKMYRAIAKVFMFGGLLNFGAQYFFTENSLLNILHFSIGLLILGIMLQALPLLRLSEATKDTCFMAIISVSIPIVILSFTRTASLTIWAMPFLFILMSVVFNKPKMLAGLTISIFFTQLAVWIKSPEIMVEINGADYITRFALLGIAIVLASFINKIYIRRLKENESQISFQKMIARISADFITINEINIDEKMNAFLSKCGRHFQADRTFFVSTCQELRSYEWFTEGSTSMLGKMPDITAGGFSWWNKQMDNNLIICFPNIELLPPEAEEEKMMFDIYNIKAFMAIPISQNGKKFGFLFFVSFEVAKVCKENNRDLLQIMANLLSESIIKMESEREINQMAFYDELTGLPNRVLFKKHLDIEIGHAQENGTYIAVVFIDLDSFKTVNDTMGHLGGDEMLRKVSRRLTECLQKKNMVARFSGDEFLVQITAVKNLDEIDRTVEKIRNSLKLPIFIKEQEFFITSSAGIAIYPTDAETSDALIKSADIARNTAKRKGKNNYCLCSQDMKDKAIRRMKMMNSLYWAQRRNELMLYYQPQIGLADNEIVGVEALLRWNNPEFGIVSPEEFIPLAEETGLINSIGQWVFEAACRQNKKWQDMGLSNLRISINISAEQFMDKKLTSIAEKALAASGLNPKHLELEITERALAKDDDYIMEMLYELKSLGVLISIDNFGKAYSSLGRLKLLPLDQVKIDMEFVRGIAEGNKNEAITKTIIQLGRNLNLNVIAEGVETLEQLEFFKKENCDEVQGYYFYRPMMAEDFELILKERVDRKNK